MEDTPKHSTGKEKERENSTPESRNGARLPPLMMMPNDDGEKTAVTYTFNCIYLHTNYSPTVSSTLCKDCTQRLLFSNNFLYRNKS